MTKRMRLSSFPTDESATHVSATQELSSTNGLLRASSTPAHGAMNEVLVLRKKVIDNRVTFRSNFTNGGLGREPRTKSAAIKRKGSKNEGSK